MRLLQIICITSFGNSLEGVPHQSPFYEEQVKQSVLKRCFSERDCRTNQYNEEQQITRTKLHSPKSFKKIQIQIFQLPLCYINRQGSRRTKRQRQGWFLSRTGGGICSPLLSLPYRASLLNLRRWIHGQMNKYDIRRKSQPEFYRVKSFFIIYSSSSKKTGMERKMTQSISCPWISPRLWQRPLPKAPEEVKLS